MFAVSQKKWNSGFEVRITSLVICTDNPWLAASPNDCVHDPNTTPYFKSLLPELAFLRHRKGGLWEPKHSA